ncbi:hypothetical protein SCHPADRAFT_900799 [Schizopora paradoxa]|uniref:Uncharacterized protein n=1 Tax=Schizopora paradoxa TaxID=27342 RepID=A0A0H2RZI8_9AGAM|nr:hypothetical protein SCHPADRAFT_900799 [Schizopora paradoxa]
MAAQTPMVQLAATQPQLCQELESQIHRVEASLEYFASQFNNAASLFQYYVSCFKPEPEQPSQLGSEGEGEVTSVNTTTSANASYRASAKEALSDMKRRIDEYRVASAEGAKLLEERNALEGIERFVYYDPEYQAGRLMEMEAKYGASEEKV